MAAFARLIPLLLVVIGGFVLYQLFVAVLFASRQQWGFTALYALMAIAGAALARTLWINKRRLSPPPR